jgi:3-oxoacyl-[acyl-carrier protein] reductase
MKSMKKMNDQKFNGKNKENQETKETKKARRKTMMEESKVAIVSGCNRGIGAGIRDSLLAQGYVVYGLNRTIVKINEENYFEINCDMSDQKSIIKATKSVLKKHKQIDVLVNNAAIRRFGSVDTLSMNDWDDSVNTNLSGVFYLTKSLMPSLIAAKGYCIMVGSHSEKYTFSEGSAYCSTKAAMRAFSECLLEEVRHYGVKVSYLSIGAVKNRNHGYDESWKLTPKDVGEFIASLIKMNKRALASYIDLRPSQPLTEAKKGIEKLQYM